MNFRQQNIQYPFVSQQDIKREESGNIQQMQQQNFLRNHSGNYPTNLESYPKGEKPQNQQEKIKVKKALDLIEIQSQTDEQSQSQEYDLVNQNQINRLETSSYFESQQNQFNTFNVEQPNQITRAMQPRQNSSHNQKNEQACQVDLSSINQNKSQQINNLLSRLEFQSNQIVALADNCSLNINQQYQNSSQHIIRINAKNQQLLGR
ncbi:hypothetical protein ABPG72_004680 [Tetrahymena utriculariae]